MTIPVIKPSFIAGELSPELFGRVDIEKFGAAASTCRNAFISYRGGAYSRGGTAFAGYSKQSNENALIAAHNGTPGAVPAGPPGNPPRLVPFQFSVRQGLVLEFGDYYMRVISQGSYVTESALDITGVTQGNPAVVTAETSAAETATYFSGSSIISSYAPGDGITLTGGVYSTPAQLVVDTTQVSYVLPQASGSGYVPGDTITLTGGSHTTAPEIEVVYTGLSSILGISNPGTGGTAGTFTLTASSTPGTIMPMQVNVTIGGTSQTVAANNGAVSSSYNAGDLITIAGGIYTTQEILQVAATEILSLSPTAAGNGWAPGDSATLAGGTTTGAPQIVVDTTLVSAVPLIVNAGSGGTPGAAVITGTTGTGTKFQANVTIGGGGSITSINSIAVAGSYTGNPTNLAAEPVTGGGLTGATVSLQMGISTITLIASSPFTVNPASGVFTVGSTSGSGRGATFLGLFGVQSLTVSQAGSYSTFPSNPVAQQSTTGSGSGVTFTFTAGAAGGITAINGIVNPGQYTTNPPALNAVALNGAGLTGATISVAMGVSLFSQIGGADVLNAGVFTANPANGLLTQSSTSGAGSGATLVGIFAPATVTVTNPGVYSIFPANPVAQGSTTGIGSLAEFNLTSAAASPFNTGDWVFIDGVEGMTQLNGRTFLIGNVSGFQFSLYDVFGNPINTTGDPAYAGGGTASRIYTLVTPYLTADLPYLKWAQSADVMSLTCWNQQTLTEYPTYDLSRLADNNWTLEMVDFQPDLQPPTGLSAASIEPPGDKSSGFYIAYYVTAVDAVTGEESRPTSYLLVLNYELGTTSGNEAASNTLQWNPVTGASSYNVYAETALPNATFLNPIQPTFIAGLIGSTSATSFTDPGIAPNFAKGLPQAQNPFAVGAVISATVTAQGSNYTSPFNQIDSPVAPGDGLINPVIVADINTTSKNVNSLIILDGGNALFSADVPLTITIEGNGVGATGVIKTGPVTGVNPGCVSYYQQRRVYASTQNNPDTIYMSQNGLYLNFDTHFPVIDSDAITATPWSVVVDGVQWMVNMPGGLVVLTGTNAWQLTGTGGSSLNPVAITPTSEQAQPQAYNGCSPTIRPINVDYQILFVESKGSIYREFLYQIFQNNYAGTDLTELSSHLFTGYQIADHCWAQEPYKMLWSVRNDGILLSMTYVKDEGVNAWARHDTQGQFVAIASITELPVDAVYAVVERVTPQGTAYFVERFDNRLWQDIDDTWCVDAGLSLGHTYPEATLTIASSTGLGSLTGVIDLVGGIGYSAGVQGIVSDDTPDWAGAPAVADVTIGAGGVIVAVTFPTPGSGYINPKITFYDPAGSAGGIGASATVVLSNATFATASAPVFSLGSVGSIIRSGGGVAQITGYISNNAVDLNILTPISYVIPNTGGVPAPVTSGNWTMDVPTTSVGGLFHLIGMTVSGLADGNVIPPQVVAADGTITLTEAATNIVVGLGFNVQAQSIYADGPDVTWQGRRKKVAAVTARLYQSGQAEMGSNQIDGSTLSPIQVDVAWSNLATMPNRAKKPYNALSQPLFTGDVRIPLEGGYGVPGQVAIQQNDPLPLNILAFVPEVDLGDLPEAGAPKSGAAQQQNA